MKLILASLFVALSLSGCACRLEPILVPAPVVPEAPAVEEPPTHVSVCYPIGNVPECSDESMIALMTPALCYCKKDI